jgi:hypothetical protein
MLSAALTLDGYPETIGLQANHFSISHPEMLNSGARCTRILPPEPVKDDQFSPDVPPGIR